MLCFVLAVSGNEVGDDGCLPLVKALGHIVNLEWLSLQKCKIGPTGITALAEQGLARLVKLKYLNLGGNEFGDEGCASLGKALGYMVILKELKLHNCKIGSTGITALAEQGLVHLVKLKYLNLCGNKVGDAGCMSLIKALTHMCTLEELWFKGCGITSQGATSLITAMLQGHINVSIAVWGIDDLSLDPSDPALAVLPVEIRISTFRRAKEYLNDLKNGSNIVYRNKVMFIGDQAVGKTSMFQYLVSLSANFRHRKVFGLGKSESVSINMTGRHINISWPNHQESLLLAPGDGCSIDGSKVTVSVVNATATWAFHQIEENSNIPVSTAPVNDDRFNLKLNLMNTKSARIWFSYINHWTNNTATDGITTAFQSLNRPDDDPINLCWLDFAGQAEMYATNQHFLSNRTAFIITWNMALIEGDCLFKCLKAELRGVLDLPEAIRHKTAFIKWSAKQFTYPVTVQSIDRLETLFGGRVKVVIEVDGAEISTTRKARYLIRLINKQGAWTSKHHQPNGLAAVEFWLRSIKPYMSSSGKPNAVFIVGTHKDQAVGTTEERRALVQRVVDKVQIGHEVVIHEVELYPTPSGVDELKATLIEQIGQLDHIRLGEKVPKAYIAIQETIGVMREEYQQTGACQIISLKELESRLSQDVKKCIEVDTHMNEARPNPAIDKSKLRNTLLRRALLLLHEWGVCVYFDRDELCDVVCLSIEYLARDTLAKLLKPSNSRDQNNGCFNGIMSVTNLNSSLKSQGVEESRHDQLLMMMEKLSISFVLETDEELEPRVVISSLLPESASTTIWPSDYPIKKQLVIYFDVVPPGLMGEITALIHRERQSLQTRLDASNVWRDGVVFDTSSGCKAVIRLESLKPKFKLAFYGDNVGLEYASQSSDQQVIAIRITGIDDESISTLMRLVVEVAEKAHRGHKSIRKWKLSEHCPFHLSTSENVHCYVDVGHKPMTCIASGLSLDIKQARQVMYFSGLQSGSRAIVNAQEMQQAEQALFESQRFNIEDQIYSVVRIKQAVCVGVSNYSEYSPFLDLQASPINDCNGLGKALGQLGFECSVLEEATKLQILTAVSTMHFEAMAAQAKLKKLFPQVLPPLLIFSFSGHGMQGPDGRQYYVPSLIDAKPESEKVEIDELYTLSIAVNEVADLLRYSDIIKPPGSTFGTESMTEAIIFADCCRQAVFHDFKLDRSLMGEEFNFLHAGQAIVYATAGGESAQGYNSSYGVFTGGFLGSMSSISSFGVNHKALLDPKAISKFSQQQQQQQQDFQFYITRMNDAVFKPRPHVLAKTLEILNDSSSTNHFNVSLILEHFQRHPHLILETTMIPSVEYPVIGQQPQSPQMNAQQQDSDA